MAEPLCPPPQGPPKDHRKFKYLMNGRMLWWRNLVPAAIRTLRSISQYPCNLFNRRILSRTLFHSISRPCYCRRAYFDFTCPRKCAASQKHHLTKDMRSLGFVPPRFPTLLKVNWLIGKCQKS